MDKKKGRVLLDYFPAPKFLTMPSVGFEVTPEAVRFVEIKDVKGESRLGKFEERRLPHSDDEDENFLDSERIKKIVAEIRDKHKLNFIRACLPEEKVYMFKTDVVNMRLAEIRDSIELKLEENVPVPPKEAVFDYQIIPSPNGSRSETLNVNVSVVPRPVVMRYLNFFQSLNLLPVSFTVSAQSVANAVIPRSDNFPVIIVNFGDRKTGLYIVSKGIVRFTSTISVGGSSLTEAIRKYFSISYVQAEKLKSEKGILRDKKNMELFYSLVSTLSVLKDEINKLSSYWETHFEHDGVSEQKIQKILLCGQEASLQGLVEYLQASLTVSVSVANVWANVFSLDKYLPPISRNDSLSYASVVGLSME